MRRDTREKRFEDGLLGQSYLEARERRWVPQSRGQRDGKKNGNTWWCPGGGSVKTGARKSSPTVPQATTALGLPEPLAALLITPDSLPQVNSLSWVLKLLCNLASDIPRSADMLYISQS